MCRQLQDINIYKNKDKAEISTLSFGREGLGDGKTPRLAAGSVFPGESLSSSSTLPGKIFTWRKAVFMNPVLPQFPCHGVGAQQRLCGAEGGTGDRQGPAHWA